MSMDKIDGMSMDIEQSERDKLRALFPQCFVEGRLDIDKLLTMCGEYIDDDFEKYEFKWKGKRDCLKLAQMRSTAALRPCEGESVNFDTTKNLYIEGDNLEVLKLLQKAYFRRVKMIYIDPPYNTNKDFVYEDDFSDSLAHYKMITSQATKSNPETMGMFHTKWLNMIYPRLRLSANLLQDEGVIFISIDDNEIHNLRKICDEVFGEENFIAMFTWRTDGNFDNQAKIKVCHEYILVYAKMIEKFPYPPVIDPNIPNTSKLFNEAIRNTIVKNGPKNPIASVVIPKGFPCELESGIISTAAINWPKYDKDIVIEGCRVVESVTASSGWASKGLLEEFIATEFSPVTDTKGQATRFCISRSGAIEAVKERLEIQSHVISVLTNFGGTQKASAEMGELGEYFDFPKPIELIKYFVKMMDGNDFICLDFFSGSATTAHAVMQCNTEDGGNRQFIMVQLPELVPEKSEAYAAGFKNICEIGKERIRRAGAHLLETYGQGVLGQPPRPLDTGFKVFKLDSSNLKTWDSSHISAEQQAKLGKRLNTMIERVKPDRTDLDMVYEVMLKLGVPLDFPVTKLDVNGTTAYSVGEDSLLLVCLAPALDVETLEQLADHAPAKMILAETSFADDSAMSNAYYTLRDRGIEFKFI